MTGVFCNNQIYLHGQPNEEQYHHPGGLNNDLIKSIYPGHVQNMLIYKGIDKGGRGGGGSYPRFLHLNY